MELTERYRRLTFWNRLNAWAALASILQLLIQIVPIHLPDRAGSGAAPDEIVGSGEGVQAPDTGGGTGVFQ